MIIVFDLGNSDLSFAAYKDDKFVAAMRTSSDKRKSVDEFSNTIVSLLSSKGISLDEVEGTILSSVVPSLTRVVKTAISRVLPAPIIVGPGTKSGLSIKTDNPSEVGSDIVACSVGAINKYNVPLIIADFGTATKIFAIDKSKSFIGCTIAPGVKTSVSKLVEIASQLPEISLDLPSKVICTNTPDCMNSGAIYGNASMLEGMVKRFEREIGEKCNLIVTGGLGSTVAKGLEIEYTLDKILIFDGLYYIYKKNLRGINHEK